MERLSHQSVDPDASTRADAGSECQIPAVSFFGRTAAAVSEVQCKHAAHPSNKQLFGYCRITVEQALPFIAHVHCSDIFFFADAMHYWWRCSTERQRKRKSTNKILEYKTRSNIFERATVLRCVFYFAAISIV